MFRCVWQLVTCPWVLTNHVPILKDKNVVHCKSITVDDFRGISISPVITKIFEHCILDGYRDYFKTSDSQFGFKHSCAHAMYSPSCVVDHYVNCGSTINICALDLLKAFDKMSHCGFFNETDGKTNTRYALVYSRTLVFDWMYMCKMGHLFLPIF